MKTLKHIILMSPSTPEIIMQAVKVLETIPENKWPKNIPFSLLDELTGIAAILKGHVTLQEREAERAERAERDV